MMRHRLLLSLLLVLPLMSTAATPPDDWAQLGRFREANAALGAPRADEARVVVLGDSITEHWSHDAPDPFGPGGWINRGISGQTTPQMLLRLRQDVIALAPRVLVIIAGTNDIAGNTGPTTVEAIAGNIASMAELARAHGIRVVIGTVPPASRYWWAPEIDPRTRIIELNHLLRRYAQQQDLVLLELHTPLADADGGIAKALAEDGVHPTAAGYRVMSAAAREAVQRALTR
ncbi:hypothetical protein KAK07_09725 [Ideonella sp. 4Y16]|uniref:SGNH hydrolase-type esterase domain-containing protein n=1 Tax=Ideonella alba TaxID=2824118 RepID=A0A940YP69_9BURK|nr:GDSL-type esterase/lipase family protein [Ideonella alba]MBQ0933314.1 hypothetical protein [Ideonella alba]MBQ0943614.1 hypothetical protein [Ideonella alba]